LGGERRLDLGCLKGVGRIEEILNEIESLEMSLKALE
jgi:hypothetical protein